MADKPKIKVEEIGEEKEKEQSPEETTTTTPKVASFSQLDSESEPKKEAPKEAAETEAKTDEDSPTGKEKEEISSSEVKEWLKEVRPDVSKEVSKSGGPNVKILIVVVIALLVLGAIVGGVIYYQRGVEQRQVEPSSDTPIVTTSTPTPTEEPIEELDLTAYSVNILNGSGTAGEAGNAESLLVEAGFVEENLQAGNADSFDYTNTEVSLKEEAPDALFEAIEEALGESYTVVRTEEPLEEASEFDVVITVGQRNEAS